MEKKFIYRINVFLMLIFSFGILTFVNLISLKHYKRFDITKSKKYSISPQTKKIIQNLKQPVEIIAFYKEKIDEKTKDILELYKSNSKFIKYKFIDPDRDVLTAKKYGITSYDTILIKSGENYEKIYSKDEKDITSAILKLTKKQKKKIYFTIGHGEKSIDENLSQLKKYLDEENYQTGQTLILRDGIPIDCDILAICGIKVDFNEKELEEIKNYIEKGKRLILFLEPGDFPNIKNFLDFYGIEIENDIIVDLASRRFLGDALSPLIINYPYHEITKDFNLACIFTTARSLNLKGNLPSGVKGDILAKTSNASWAEKNIKEIETGKIKFDENDKTGPLPVACVVEKENKEGLKARIAVFGDSDFITDKFINFSGNKDFVLNTINYLAEEEVLISIRPKKEENQPLILSSKSGKFIFLFPVFIVPVLITGIGSFIVIKRKLFY